LRIGIDASRATLAQRTGVEGYSLNLIRELLKLETEHEFILYFNRPPREGLFQGMGKAHYEILPFPRLWTQIRLATHILFHRPDLLLITAHILPLAYTGPSVVTVHDLGFLVYPKTYRLFDLFYLSTMTPYSSWRARRIIADSQATKDDLTRYYRTSPDKIRVVPLGVDTSFFRPADPAQSQATARRYGIEGPYILYVGTLQPRKNLHRLLEAYATVRNWGFASHRLVLAGKLAHAYPSLVREVRELGLEDSVLFPGFVAAKDLPALMSGCDAFVLPSLYEGFGLPILEAMACGAPVIASNVSSMPEVVGDAGLLTDPFDTDALALALRRVLSERDTRQELRQRGLQRASQFTWERCARETMAVLEEAHQTS